MKQLITILLVMFSVLIVKAQENGILVSSNTVGDYYLLVSTVKKDKYTNKLTAWFKVIYKEQTTIKGIKYSGVTEMERFVFDCQNDEIGISDIVTYSKSSKVLRSIHLKDYEIEMNPLPPGSTGDIMLTCVCNSFDN